jgi:hypothetical protein
MKTVPVRGYGKYKDPKTGEGSWNSSNGVFKVSSTLERREFLRPVRKISQPGQRRGSWGSTSEKRAVRGYMNGVAQDPKASLP